MVKIEEGECKEKIKTTLETLKNMETWHGLYYNWYYVADGSLMKDWGEFISTVDNGWLTSALVIVGQYFPDLSETTDQLVTQMDNSRSEEHTSELQSRGHLVCRLLLEK